MDTQDIIYLSMGLGSWILAIFPAWKLYPRIKKKIENGKFTKYMFQRAVKHHQILFLLSAVFWGVTFVLLVAIYEFLK